MQDRLRFDLNGISRICVGLLWLTVLAEVIYAANSYGMRAFLNDLESGALVGAALNSEAERLDFQAKIVGFGYLAIFVLCVIFSGVWIYRASWNAREIQPNDARITPGWAVGWFFVPIMSFWKPYQAIVQTGNSSEDPTGDMDDSPPGFVQLWWTLWVVTSLAGNFSFRRSMKAETIDDYRLITTIDLVCAPLSILAALLFMKLIRTITAAQQDKKPASQRVSAPPSAEGKPI
jgi:hypothetical protein